MLSPRGSFVVLKLIEKAERQHGKIVVPQNKECYCEAEVVAVGPGSVMSAGAVSETADLKAGQRVWVKHKAKNRPGLLDDAGLQYQDEGVTYHVFEQSSIVGILAQPGEAPLVEKTPDVPVTRILHA